MLLNKTLVKYIMVLLQRTKTITPNTELHTDGATFRGSGVHVISNFEKS